MMDRREFLAAAIGMAGAAMALRVAHPEQKKIKLVSPGCRRSMVRVAKLYLGVPRAHWPTPLLDLNAEVQRYEAEFERLKAGELRDVNFVITELVTSVDRAKAIAEQLKDVDGVLIIHLSMGIMGMLTEILRAKRPTVLFAAPYSGHEWTAFGALCSRPEGALLDCILSSDMNQLAVAIRPFRALHHLREAKILDIAKRDVSAFAGAVKERFGTEIKVIDRDRVLKLYDGIPDNDAIAEAEVWIKRAEKVVEPPREEIIRSCKLALALEKLLDEEDATVVAVDCYGTMWRQLPAYPCLSHCRMNNMGFGGICESDLQCALTHIIFQGLVGKPGFISDPTVDESQNSIILAHCMGTTKMDGPEGEEAPYKLRSVMERQEGVVVQPRMRVGQRVTQAILLGTKLIRYFTGTIIDTPDLDRGCRTKITVKVDGDVVRLWQNWSGGLHRQTVYGDIVADLKRFCKFAGIELINELA
ncbi:MAG: hypothetical protein RMK18_12000 [Armatimonadota bacterium]|nr:hypothetical protein [Armatimonadota bacterium]MCX7778172.1 hypothetical protein [Armatimonadota bacterium]MDW8026570.1 hypothetical protein [Armatimonadota bacterium]